MPLRINGKDVTAEQVSKVVRPGMSTNPFDLEAGEHTVTFTDQGGSLEMTFNGATKHVGEGAVELHLSTMAACIGDACLMWTPPLKRESEAEFMTRQWRPEY